MGNIPSEPDEDVRSMARFSRILADAFTEQTGPGDGRRRHRRGARWERSWDSSSLVTGHDHAAQAQLLQNPIRDRAASVAQIREVRRGQFQFFGGSDLASMGRHQCVEGAVRIDHAESLPQNADQRIDTGRIWV